MTDLTVIDGGKHPHVLATPTQCIMFTTAGDAFLTLKSEASGVHYTYHVVQAKNDAGEPVKRWFVHVLSGADAYTYVGVVERTSQHDDDETPWRFRLTQKSKLTHDAAPVKAFMWYVGHVFNGKRLPAALEVWHEGRCGMCGRMLTRPDSIALGIGPVCAEKMGLQCHAT